MRKPATASSNPTSPSWPRRNSNLRSSRKLRVESATPAHGRPTLLWIDDYEPGLAMYRAMFEAQGFQVLTATSGEAAIDILMVQHADLVVTDYEMPVMNGEQVALAVKALRPGTPVLLFSGSIAFSPRLRRMVDGVCDKAGSRHDLIASVQNLIRGKRSPELQAPSYIQPHGHQHRTVA